MTAQSLEDIEGDVWPDPGPDSTYLVRTVHTVRRIPIDQLTVEDLRITLGQHVGSAVLAPLALELLERDPFAEGDFYPGDLLSAVLGLPPDFWRAHPEQAARLDDLLARVRWDDEEVRDAVANTSIMDRMAAYRAQR